jgi:hypothetical protein
MTPEMQDFIDNEADAVLTPSCIEIPYVHHCDGTYTLRVPYLGDVRCDDSAEAAGVLLDM